MDEADRAQIEIDQALAEAIRQASADIKHGNPGDCDLCGEYSVRLIDGACAPCRDKYRIK